jgi:hypothetical protein
MSWLQDLLDPPERLREMRESETQPRGRQACSPTVHGRKPRRRRRLDSLMSGTGEVADDVHA